MKSPLAAEKDQRVEMYQMKFLQIDGKWIKVLGKEKFIHCLVDEEVG
jgi:hypothetical protein